jgi:hypothetical protein
MPLGASSGAAKHEARMNSLSSFWVQVLKEGGVFSAI